MKIFKTGIIGCGRIGSLLENDPLRGKPCTHAGGFSKLSNVKLVAGCDINESRLKSFGKQWKVKNLYTDYHEMLSENRLDILCIATWTNQHANIALDGVRAGIKGIFCEKPIDVDLKLARKLVRTCESKNIPLSINHERRWDAYYVLAHKIIQAGKIGEIKTIVGNALSWKPGELPVSDFGGGPLFHDGTHLIDLLLYFGGPIEWVSGYETRPKGKRYIEEMACAMMRFKNGAMAFIEGGGARKYFNFELDIQGSEGRLLIGNSGRELYLTKKSKRFKGFQELEKVPFPEPKKNESPFVVGARDMLKSIRTGKPGKSTGKDGLKALEIIYSVYKSSQQKGKRLKIQ
ncbi:MAG: Gfo/Idh/MocA family oxidoreductase [Nitrospinota bacterium]